MTYMIKCNLLKKIPKIHLKSLPWLSRPCDVYANSPTIVLVEALSHDGFPRSS